MNILETSVNLVADTAAPVTDAVISVFPFLDVIAPVVTAAGAVMLWQWIPLF